MFPNSQLMLKGSFLHMSKKKSDTRYRSLPLLASMLKSMNVFPCITGKSILHIIKGQVPCIYTSKAIHKEVTSYAHSPTSHVSVSEICKANVLIWLQLQSFSLASTALSRSLSWNLLLIGLYDLSPIKNHALQIYIWPIQFTAVNEHMKWCLNV